jgi:hypothetical protein
MGKIPYGVVLVFALYCWVRVSVNRRFYTKVELVIWLTLIGLATGWCAMELFFG